MTTLLAAAFLLSQILCQLLVTVDCRDELPSGYVRYPGDNKTAIKVYHEQLEWDDARERCIAEGADLAVATTSEKITFIQNRKESDDVWAVWLGIHRPSGVGSAWIRVDTGSQLEDDAPWVAVSRYEESNCAATLLDGITNYYCTFTFEFACEMKVARDENIE